MADNNELDAKAVFAKSMDNVVTAPPTPADFMGMNVILDPTMPKGQIDVIDKNGRRPAIVNLGDAATPADKRMQ